MENIKNNYLKLKTLMNEAKENYKIFQLLNSDKKITKIFEHNLKINSEIIKNACLYKSIMLLCRVFVDLNKHAYTINKLLKDIKKNCSQINDSNIKETVSFVESKLQEKEKTMSRLRKRRNKQYAHNDKDFFINERKIKEELPLYFSDKEGLIMLWEIIEKKLDFIFNIKSSI